MRYSVSILSSNQASRKAYSKNKEVVSQSGNIFLNMPDQRAHIFHEGRKIQAPLAFVHFHGLLSRKLMYR